VRAYSSNAQLHGTICHYAVFPCFEWARGSHCFHSYSFEQRATSAILSGWWRTCLAAGRDYLRRLSISVPAPACYSPWPPKDMNDEFLPTFLIISWEFSKDKELSFAVPFTLVCARTRTYVVIENGPLVGDPSDFLTSIKFYIFSMAFPSFSIIACCVSCWFLSIEDDSFELCINILSISGACTSCS